VRHRLPDTRPSIAHKFSIQGHEGYIHVGMYEDHQPGEIFVTMAKEGSTISGLMDAFATSISLTLQYGVPLRDLVQKFSHMRFEPMGMTENRELPMAQSIIDYLFRWMGSQFLSKEDKLELGILTVSERMDQDSIYSGVQPELVAAPVQPIADASRTWANGDGQVASPTRRKRQRLAGAGGGHGRVQADAPCASCGWIMSRRCVTAAAAPGCS
jgi:ribonucleoside-diphosphate reductase alpha chain